MDFKNGILVAGVSNISEAGVSKTSYHISLIKKRTENSAFVYQYFYEQESEGEPDFNGIFLLNKEAIFLGRDLNCPAIPGGVCKGCMEMNLTKYRVNDRIWAMAHAEEKWPSWLPTPLGFLCWSCLEKRLQNNLQKVVPQWGDRFQLKWEHFADVPVNDEEVKTSFEQWRSSRGTDETQKIH